MRLSIVAVLLCGTALPGLAQDMSAARDASARFTAAIGKADAATAGQFFADDAVALPPGRGPLYGKVEIQRFLGNMVRFTKDPKYVSDDVKAIDDTTMREIGTFSFTMANGKGQAVAGKYLLIWTKTGGDWKISADMWNRSTPGGAGKGGGAGMTRGGATTKPGGADQE